MALLPLENADELDPFEYLEARNWRLAKAVEASSRQRRVRRFRSQILLLLLELRCPLGVTPRKRHYVPGAVVRLGIGGIRRLWKARWGEEPMTLRTFQTHVGKLEEACCLVRAPGDWLPCRRDPKHPERRPAHRQTFHLLESDEVAEWWAGPGQQLLEQRPEVQFSIDRWRMVFGNWRRQAAQWALEEASGSLFDTVEDSAPAPREISHPKIDALGLERLGEVAHRGTAEASEIVAALDAAGVRVRGPNRLRLQQDLPRLRGAVALLIVALRRGDRIRNAPGWVVRTATRAPVEDLRAAMARTSDLAWSSPTPGADRASLENLFGREGYHDLRRRFTLEP